MKKLIIVVLLLVSTLTTTNTEVKANVSGNDGWYFDFLIATYVKRQIVYEGVSPNVYTFPSKIEKITNNLVLDNDPCNYLYTHDDFETYDIESFERIDERKIKYIGTSPNTTYDIQIKGTVIAKYGFLCLSEKKLDDQIITVEFTPNIGDFIATCSTWDIGCQAETVEKGIGELPDLIDNASTTISNINSLVNGFPAVQFAMAFLAIAVYAKIKGWMN